VEGQLVRRADSLFHDPVIDKAKTFNLQSQESGIAVFPPVVRSAVGQHALDMLRSVAILLLVI
jgi:hypothetical protein